MPAATSLSERPAAIRVDLGAIFVSMELSRSKWLITSLSPGGGEKMSKHLVAGGDLAGLLNLFAALQAKTQARTGHSYRTVVIQEAGLDGFWIHRALEKEGIESHVVRPSLDHDFAAEEASQDGPHRWRGAGAGAPGLQARRAAGLLDG